MRSLFICLLAAALAITGAGMAKDEEAAAAAPLETITFGAGCFWCVEAVLERLEGVESAVSGYMGGSVDDPTYEQVCTGETGHAEVVRVTFDRSKLPLEELLDFFWILHDPTTLNRQGADRGTQYRSAIFYHSEAQRAAAEASKAKADASGKFSDPIVTEITPASTFYEAEAYHQAYYEENPNAGYCRYVIHPKLKKLGLE
jgi:peptide-methionine (S)-S-oxide reductase